MLAYQLAEILLNGRNIPVVVRSGKTAARFIENIFVLQNEDSPFENCFFLDFQMEGDDVDVLEVDL